MAGIEKSQVEEVKRQRDQLFEMGISLQKNWVEFFLGVRDFQEAVIFGRRKWEICGYRSWPQFVVAITTKMGESRATFYAKLRTVKALPPAKIRELGKTKSHYAARLAKQGKLTPENEKKIRESSTEKAKSFTRKVASQVEEGRMRLTLNLLESQYYLFEQQMIRLKSLLVADTNEAALDFILSHISQLDDQTIIQEFEGWKAEKAKKVNVG